MKHYDLNRFGRACICLALCIMCVGNLVAFAAGDGPISLDDVVNGTPVESVDYTAPQVAPTESVQAPAPQAPATGTTGSGVVEQADAFIGQLEQAGRLETSGKEVAAVTQPIVKYVGMAVQVICVLVTVCLGLRVAIDLLYIVAPFSRKFLANGHVGNPMAATQNPAQPGMGGAMGGMGPMGAMGGMGGYGGGYGGRYGGYGGYGGMGAMGAMGGMGGMQNQMANQANSMSNQMGRIQFVSGAALNAVAAENTVGPDGKPVKPLVQYGKDCMLTLIFTSVLLVLLLTGAFQHIGFGIGNLVSRMVMGVSL